jgi:tetratricopeptide (TPR) repeat protein
LIRQGPGFLRSKVLIFETICVLYSFEMQSTSNSKEKSRLAAESIEAVKCFVTDFTRNPSAASHPLIFYYNFLGENYIKIGDTKTAYEHFLKAEAIVLLKRDELKLTEVMGLYKNLGECELVLGLHENALGRIKQIQEVPIR